MVGLHHFQTLIARWCLRKYFVPDDNRNSPLKAWVRALEMIAPIAGNTFVAFPVLVETPADKFDTAPALLSDRECLTYGALTERTQIDVPRRALGQGLAAGDVVCLLMRNWPEYMTISLGITRIGVIAYWSTSISAVRWRTPSTK